MKVAWLHDAGNADGTKGGAELTMDELRAQAPEGTEFDPDGDTVVIGNCVTISPDIIPSLEGKRVFRYHHDLARHEDPTLREWLDAYAEHIFTSPLHRERYGRDGTLIPPAIDLDAFKPNRQTRRHGKRKGTVCVASWQNPGKGGHLLSETARQMGLTVDVYGAGPCLPYGDHINLKGPVSHRDLPALLWQYETFIYLPTVAEPFGRCVVEAHYAGCEIITNDLVGSRWWIENDPDALETAAADFWGLVRD